MSYEDYIQDALDMVSAWELAEEDLAGAVNEQARLMAGLGIEPSHQQPLDNPYLPLRF